MLLKVMAVVLSCSWWLHMNYNKEIACHVHVPVLFEHVPTEASVCAPETVRLTLKGTRSHLYGLDQEQLAVHVDCKDLKQGPQELAVTRQKIFLPESVTVLDYTPCSITIS